MSGLPGATIDHSSYAAVRAASEALCAPLETDDYGVQPMDDASPPKWHLAHTTWFFETFLLKPLLPGYRAFDERFEFLFNSYYNGIGEQYPRPRRGVLSRPTVDAVYEYRRHVDAAMASLLERPEAETRARVELGLHHEQQHQELLLTDIKCILGTNPLLPAYRRDLATVPAGALDDGGGFIEFDGGIISVGACGPEQAFCFDNELPRHDVLLRPFALADRLVSNGEFLAFVEDGGYRRPELWLSDGWAAMAGQPAVDAPDRRPGVGPRPGPLYWYREDGEWFEYRLCGPAPLRYDLPVTHVSFYEADAFSRWAGCRLPTEHEWEVVACEQPVVGNFADAEVLHPRLAAGGGRRPAQMFGDVWEWTASPYVAYPGYRPLPGTLGEYNGKFMSNQLVLRGGSCATPEGHVRPSYRNFFYPGDRWQFTGIRLAHDL
ncbi:MAG: ergothioneine biosynthesis protein EgtB [Pseudomonadota bacterium]